MDDKHTPGPWENSHGTIYAAGDELIADTVGEQVIPFDQAVANARLIAAAPALLDALREARRIFGGHSGAPHDPITDIEIEQRAAMLDRMHEAIRLATEGDAS